MLWVHLYEVCVCLVTQLCPTLCNPIGYSPPGSLVHGNSPGKNTGVACHALLQGIFPTQGSNPRLLHCRWILLSEPLGKPKNTGVHSLSLLQQIFPTEELNHGVLHCRRFLYQLSHQGNVISYLKHDDSRENFIYLFILDSKILKELIDKGLEKFHNRRDTGICRK